MCRDRGWKLFSKSAWLRRKRKVIPLFQVDTFDDMAPQRAGQKRKVVEVPRPSQPEEDDLLGNGLLDGAIDDGSSSDEDASEDESEDRKSVV